jgi:flagellar protein FlaG
MRTDNAMSTPSSYSFLPTSQAKNHLKNNNMEEGVVLNAQQLYHKPDYELSGKEIEGKKEIEKIFKELQGIETSLRFSVHEKTKQILVKVINDETKEVIREIPPEKIIDLVANMMEKAGLIVDKRM